MASRERCPHGRIRSMVPCYLGCDDPNEVAARRRRAKRRRMRPSPTASRATRVPALADALRSARLEPLLVQVAERHGLTPDEVRGGRRGNAAALAARADLALLAETELMMSEAEVSRALGMNASTLPAALSRRAS